MEKQWAVTLSPLSVYGDMKDVRIEAQTCEEQNGALIFRGGQHLSVTHMVAAGRWLVVRQEEDVALDAEMHDGT